MNSVKKLVNSLEAFQGKADIKEVEPRDAEPNNENAREEILTGEKSSNDNKGEPVNDHHKSNRDGDDWAGTQSDKETREEEKEGEKQGFEPKQLNEGYEVDSAAHDQPKSSSSLSSAWTMLWILPENLIVKPSMVIWFIIVYPISYAFGSKSIEPSPSKANDSNVEERQPEYNSIVSDELKSPLTSSKYLIPPPLRLYPISRNPGKKKKKTLVLDLDETLIHSLSRGSPRSFAGTTTKAQMIEVNINQMSTLYYVHKRPNCDLFLKESSKHYNLHIFTASVQEYADPIVDWLEESIMDRKSRKLFGKRFYRHDCTYREGVGYIKDLSKFFPPEDMKNVIILDNSPISYALNEDNAVRIEGWINDQSDKDLLSLLPMLQSLSICIDVRYILGLRNGEKSFEY